MTPEKKTRKKKEPVVIEPETLIEAAPSPNYSIEECLRIASTLSVYLQGVYDTNPESEIYSNLNRVDLLIRSLTTLTNKK